MAPSRRRGANKAAAAAAARRQWKVGDLVLAKVKGFPAWPAMVSEPEKWGYTADWKKVLVYFFGTQQIAFCNPADVEAFTEEKKQSLLMKHHGKVSDFGRAVKEIVDSYEKSKQQEKVDGCNSGDEGSLPTGGNSLESSAHFELQDRLETSEATVTGRNDSSLQNGNALGETKVSSLHDNEALEEQPTDNVPVTRKPILATYTSRRRSGGSRSRKQVMQAKPQLVEKSRSSSRLESRLQNFAVPSKDSNRSGGDASTSQIRDGSLRRSKRLRRSPEASEWDDVDSSAYVSNGSVEDDGSEIVAVDSDSYSLNEGSTIDTGSKPEHSETLVTCFEGEAELSKGLDFEINAVVIKKKRKPNRKRLTSGGIVPTARMETEADLDCNIRQNSRNACENLNERYNKDDGDEHLPLVKRARVRMGKLSSLDEGCHVFPQADGRTANEVAVNMAEESISFCQAEERSFSEVVVNRPELNSPFQISNDDFFTNRNCFAVKGALDNASSPRICAEIPMDKPQVSRDKENQSANCSDGEAALPPSKRLHRALEAMSANAADEGQTCTELSTRKTLINDTPSISPMSSSPVGVESKESNGLGEQGVDALANGASAIFSSANTTLDEATKSPLKEIVGNQNTDSSKGQETCKDGFPDDIDHYDDKSVSAQVGVQAQSPVCLTANLVGRQAATDKEKSESIGKIDLGVENGDRQCDASEQIGMGSNCVSQADEGVTCQNEKYTLSRDDEISLKLTSQVDEIASVECKDDKDVPHCTYSAGKEAHYESAPLLKSQVGDINQTASLYEVGKDVKCDSTQREASDVSMLDHVSEKDILVVQSSLGPADGVESPALTSPPSTSICHVSTAESANFAQNGSCSTPNGHLHLQKSACSSVADEEKTKSPLPQRPKSVGKGSNYAEAHHALSSFEGTLGSLTRTKESIGRATRIAIDCAKFGFSAKVVEILARTLESESNLHKRVDLFFLVDSIAQCSRGLKGDVGGIYPSAILAVLPRLLSAAAPPGSHAQENRRQCLKVLRLWLERRILPDSVIRHHMRELDCLGGSSSAGAYSRRSARTERALDDPVREMEGMLVDEYGSNSSFQLPGFCMPRMIRDEDDGSDSDGESFEAVTPEHNLELPEEKETIQKEKHTHILEDVDGELEMEDVSPSCDVEMNSTNGSVGGDVACNSHDQFEHLPSLLPPLPQDEPRPSPALPSAPAPPPPPPPPPPLSAPPSCALYSNGVDSNLHSTSHSVHSEIRQSVTQHSVPPRINPPMSSAGCYHAPECRDQMQMQPCNSTRSFSSYPVHPLDSVHRTDGPSFHRKAYPPRPPNPSPSNQFSYMQSGQHVKSRRENAPPSYSHRFHYSHNADSGIAYDNHDRMRLPPYEPNESWRFPPPNFPGPRYPEKMKASYAAVPYGGPPREPSRLPHQGWGYPPREVHQRNYMPFRPPSEGPLPVVNRGPGFWRPR